MPLNCKQCDKNVNKWFMSIVSIDFQDGVTDVNVSANESRFFSIVRMPNDA